MDTVPQAVRFGREIEGHISITFTAFSESDANTAAAQE